MNRITTLVAVGTLAAASPLLPAATGAAHAQYDQNGRNGQYRQYGYGNESSVTRRPTQSLEARLSTDRSQYSRRRAVEITMSLTNVGRGPHSPYVGGAREYDFWVRDGRTNEIVYTLSKHRQKATTQPYLLQPGEARRFRELWDQRDDDGRRVGAGAYVIESRIWPQQTVSTQVYLSNEDGPSGPRPRPRPDDPDYPDHPSDNDRLRTTLRADQRRASPGETVRFSYTVTNLREEPVTLTFPSSKQFDITASMPNGSLAWQHSQDRFYTQAVTRVQLDPGEQKVFGGSWRIPSNTPSGVYNVTAFLTPMNARGRAYAAASFRLGVGNAGNIGGGGVYNGGFTPGAPPQGGVYDGGFTPGSPPSDRGNVVANPSNGPVIMNGVHLVGLRTFVGPQAANYVGRRVTISGTYMGQKGGFGAPPRTRSDWVVAGDGTTIYVSGAVPNDARVGANIVATGTVRRTNDGRLYIDAN